MATSQFGSSTPWAKAVAASKTNKKVVAPAPKKNVAPAPAAKKPVTAKKPVVKKVTPKPLATPVGVEEEVTPTEDVTTAAETITPWSLESDPLYQQALGAGQAQFNYARNAALAENQNLATNLNQQRKALDVNATEARRRNAGNYAARGMAGGAAGALTMAEARMNADQVASQTSLADQLTAVNAQFLQNYGAIGSDWTGTLVGQQYKTNAAQQALEAALARYGTI